ncbi:MAG: helix-turn-helix transcriptional regulator [Bacteroidales bacterium]|nr:helix-turn-helix transcriptional regulator [Bacteroidales bacterium]
MGNISSFIKYQRKKQGLTQEDLAAKAGVGIRFIRDMEQGKETLQLNKVEQVLALFGFQLAPEKQQLDAYDIFWNYLHEAVKITLTNKISKYGIIIKEIIDIQENKITAWLFVPNNNALKYQQKPEDSLTEIIQHRDIQQIEIQ